jgi:hypothetical protein
MDDFKIACALERERERERVKNRKTTLKGNIESQRKERQWNN